jgi:pimeloyl-ACP methyl ester carboxylesterase
VTAGTIGVMTRMFTTTAGAGAPALVFVHGFACDHTDWKAQLDAFAPQRAVAACDLRGHGATPGTPDETTIETFGADVAALVAERGLAPAVLVGHSMGCRVVLEAYRTAPERVAALVLVDGGRMGTGDPDQAREAMRAAIEFTGFPAFAEPFFAQMFLRPSVTATRVVERAKRLPEAVGKALFPAMIEWDARRMDAALAGVRVPLMVIQTTAIGPDRKRVPLAPGATSPWLDLVRAQVPAARIEVIPHTGHFPQIEVPERVNALIADFVAAHFGAAPAR